MSEIKIRGYAAPFESYGMADILEIISRGAFDRFLARKDPSISVPVQLYAHDDTAIILNAAHPRSTRLFSDSFGLGFEIPLDDSDRQSWNVAERVVRGGYGYASVMIHIHSERREASSGARRVLEASISHIALVRNPAYAATAVWPAGFDLTSAPQRIKDAAQSWAAGRDRALSTGKMAFFSASQKREAAHA